MHRNTATLTAGPLRFQCAIGRSGVRAQGIKLEGDGATPRGCFRPLRVFYRSDRVARPFTTIPITVIRPNLGWCDQAGSGQYNRLVTLPHRFGCERMWRDDHLYDLVIQIDHNCRPRIQGRGSAVFIHVAKFDLSATEGCVAMKLKELRRLVESSSPKTAIHFS